MHVPLGSLSIWHLLSVTQTVGLHGGALIGFEF